MAEFIEVREVGLRDGIQNIKTVVPTDLKLAWIKAEVAAGVRDIEVCSFVPPKLLPQFADAEEVTRRAAGSGLTVAALMPNLKGAERGAALGVHRLDYVVSVSEGHNLNNVRRSTAESLADLQRIADFLKPSRRASVRACCAGSRPRSAAPSRATCRMTAW
jgi:hydroxymethylglutaryl-CoA lyase